MKFVIVGSGVAGALIGWRLAESGHQVTILEAGPQVKREEAVRRYRQSVVQSLDAPYPPAEFAGVPILGDWESHLRQEGPELFMGVYLRLLGGTTWHWLGTALRLHPSDFRMHTLYGVGQDWPLSYEDLEPWYDKAELALGVSGPQGPLPIIPQAGVDRLFAQAAQALGWQVVPLPQARLSRSHQGRPACCGSASCIPICPIGAKYDATIHLKLAQAAGAEILTHHQVAELQRGASGRVNSALCLRPKGEPVTVTGDCFVLAAHAVETPRLLLLSGLANSSDQVGRNLMGGRAVMSWGLAEQPANPYRAPLATSGFLEFRDNESRGEQSGFLTTIATDGWPAGYGPPEVSSELIANGLRGHELRSTLQDRIARQVALVSTVEELPRPENRITLAREWPDVVGLPRPRVQYHPAEPYTQRGMLRAERVHSEIFEAARVSEVSHADSVDPAYLLGTTRMGHDPATSVVDASLRCHDHPNLYLVGSQVFPTSGTAPPTLTIAALALRLADHLNGFDRSPRSSSVREQS